MFMLEIEGEFTLSRSSVNDLIQIN